MKSDAIKCRTQTDFLRVSDFPRARSFSEQRERKSEKSALMHTRLHPNKRVCNYRIRSHSCVVYRTRTRIICIRQIGTKNGERDEKTAYTTLRWAVYY